MNALRIKLLAVAAAIVLSANFAMAQANATLDFYGHYFTPADANRVAGLINEGNAPGWSNAAAEQTANSVTGTYGVYARRVAPQAKGGLNPPQTGGNVARPNPGLAANPELAVTITWNTKSDIDLWVTEPNGEKCSYQHRTTARGGVLHEDNVTGFGPEHYTISKAGRGTFIVSVNNFRGDTPTTVTVEVTRFAGTPNQTTQQYTVHVQRSGQTVEVCRVQY